MTVLMTPEDIVDLAAIDDRVEAAMREIVTEWWPHPDFPEPMQILHQGPIWYWPAVVAWRERNGR